jgi:hypothetical protein
MATNDDTMTKADLLKGGPGLDGYAYQADIYCVDCGRAIIDAGPEAITWPECESTEHTPQPIFFGEHEVPQHCADCGTYL